MRIEDIHNGDKLVTDLHDKPGNIFAHYTCAVQHAALSRYKYFATENAMGSITTGVCEFCQQTFRTQLHKEPLSDHFI